MNKIKTSENRNSSDDFTIWTFIFLATLIFIISFDILIKICIPLIFLLLLYYGVREIYGELKVLQTISSKDIQENTILKKLFRKKIFFRFIAFIGVALIIYGMGILLSKTISLFYPILLFMTFAIFLFSLLFLILSIFLSLEGVSFRLPPFLRNNKTIFTHSTLFLTLITFILFTLIILPPSPTFIQYLFFSTLLFGLTLLLIGKLSHKDQYSSLLLILSLSILLLYIALGLTNTLGIIEERIYGGLYYPIRISPHPLELIDISILLSIFIISITSLYYILNIRKFSPIKKERIRDLITFVIFAFFFLLILKIFFVFKIFETLFL